MHSNPTILGIVDIDTYLLGKKCGWWDDDSPCEFYKNLAKEMIDNMYGDRRMRSATKRHQQQRVENDYLTRAQRQARFVEDYCQPTQKQRKDRSGKPSRFLLQGRCGECGKKATTICMLCKEEQDYDEKEPWMCSEKSGRKCFRNHGKSQHSAYLQNRDP